MFRLLNKDEIECRVAIVNATGCSILLYKDARCDMNILDETVGAFNWKREHSRDNANCTVSLWDKDKAQWISKEDTGVESFTEKEKGLASDSFKRACFNWGIGRELYTAPFIWIDLDQSEVIPKDKGFTTKARFFVQEITYENKTIKDVVIVDKKGRTRFGKGKVSQTKKDNKENERANQTQIDEIKKLAKQKGAVLGNIPKHYGVIGLVDMTFANAKDCIEQLRERKDI
jgi:hypothetical protein